jgi:nitrous oxidase accessory protein
LKLRILLFLLVFSFAHRKGVSKTVVVSQQGAITTIKEAVARSVSGDTILVKSGKYHEGNILIDKSLTIIGQHYPEINGENKHEIFIVHADHVTITGFRFADTGHGSINDLAAIKVLDSKFVRVQDNEFKDTFFGIHLSNSSSSWIVNNRLRASARSEHQTGNGIHLWKCHHVTVDNNVVKGHRDGIYFEFVTNTLITNNTSEDNKRYGLHFMFSHNNEYRKNIFRNNGAGVAVMYTTGVKMIDNLFESNWGPASYGMLLKDIRDSYVTGNRFVSNSVAIFMEGSSRIEFENNSFRRNGYAIRLQASCDDNLFTRNNFAGNTFDVATNGSLVLNKMTQNHWDKYEGYDLDNDNTGDVPYRPVSLYSMVIEEMPVAVLLWRSFFVFLMDRAEKVVPAITPENLKDDSPSMTPHDLH